MDPSEQPLRELEAAIALAMPTALDMIADVVESPATNAESYKAILEVAEAQAEPLFLALLRAAAGIAFTADLSPDQIRALADPEARQGYPG